MAKFVIIVATLFVVSMASVIDVEKEAAQKLKNLKEECQRSISRAQEEIDEKANAGYYEINKYYGDWRSISATAVNFLQNAFFDVHALKTIEPQVELLTPKNRPIRCTNAIAEDLIRIVKDVSASFDNLLCTEPECRERQEIVSKCNLSIEKALLKVQRLYKEAPTDQRLALRNYFVDLADQVYHKLGLETYKATTKMIVSNENYTVENTFINCSSEVASAAVTGINHFMTKYNESLISGDQLESNKQKCIDSLKSVTAPTLRKISNSDGKSYFEELDKIGKPLQDMISTDFPAIVKGQTVLVLSDDPEIFCSDWIAWQAREALEKTKKEIRELEEKYNA